ncbi:MAG: tetratricopeptide repeat protein [Acidobacteriota bacterium]
MKIAARVTRRTLISLALTAAAGFGLVAHAAATESEQLWIHRNLGKAFYENPTTQYEAVGELEKAVKLAPDSAVDRVNWGLALLRAGQEDRGVVELEKAQKQDPSLPHTWFNLGIAYKRASRYDEARVQLEQMVKLIPGDAIAQFNLGVLYKLDGRLDEAIERLEKAAELDPNLAGPHFQLATAYRQQKDMAAAKREMARFREIKAKQGDSSEDLEWSWYAELQEERLPEHVAAGAPADLTFEATALARSLDPASAGLRTLDLDGDGGLDLLVYSKAGVQVYRDGAKAVDVGLGKIGATAAAAPGDFDGDGLADLVVVPADASAAPTLWRNVGGRFASHPSTLPAGRFNVALWIDDDHDYDLDLFLIGADAARVRNQGASGFADETEGFPFVADGEAIGAEPFRLVADTQAYDFVVLYRDRPAVLYRDHLAGRYTAEPLPASTRGAQRAITADVDHDGWGDLLLAGPQGVEILHNGEDGWLLARVLRPIDGPRVARGAGMLAFADLENRGVSDLVTGAGLHRNRGQLGFDAPRTAPFDGAVVALEAADWTGDGRIDLAAVGQDGTLTLARNATPSADGRWLRLRLHGIKNPPLAPGAVVELKAGTRYQKKIYRGVPLHFGLGSAAEADTLRITWPNGAIQNETRQRAGATAEVKEAQRLSGSCPMVYTWNGETFEFITDVLGVAPLGVAMGNGEVLEADDDEYIWIHGESLVARDGVLEIRVTEELREVAYIDQVRLLAIDHPADVTIVHNDKFKSPPFPEHRLFGSAEIVRPVAARDHRGRDVMPRLAARDETYVDGFQRDYMGIAESHALELDFGRAAGDGSHLDDAVLVLSGWVDWADGSTFLGLAQEAGSSLVMPALEMRDASGEWVTVIEDMGIPAGKPKTIAVELSGLWPSDAREVRIASNLALYWDEAYLLPTSATPEHVETTLAPTRADLRFRGFARPVVHPERLQPERFVYADWQPTTMWNPIPGNYTRFGDIGALIDQIDDRLAIFGAGDEMLLHFDADALPPLAEGWQRNYLFFVAGWAKDGDANTGHGDNVAPLPFRGMTHYPYGPNDAYPAREDLQRDLETYHVRPALRLLRPLADDVTRTANRPQPAADAAAEKE